MWMWLLTAVLVVVWLGSAVIVAHGIWVELRHRECACREVLLCGGVPVALRGTVHGEARCQPVVEAL